MNEALTFFNRNVTAFIDGSLAPQSQAEFEAFLRTHPEFINELETKQAELDYIKSFIPKVELSRDVKEALTSELKQSVFLLVRPKNATFFQKLKMSVEEWANR